MHRSMQDFRRLMEETDLSHSQVSALLQLFHCGSCGISDIGEHLGISNAASSQMIDRLVQQALVLRQEDPDDRRFKRLLLSPRGREIIEANIESKRRWVTSLTTALSAEERATIIQALNLLTGAALRLEETEQAPDPARNSR